MTNNLHEFVPPFTLYLNVENAQNPAWKHFEKTNIKVLNNTFPFQYSPYQGLIYRYIHNVSAHNFLHEKKLQSNSHRNTEEHSTICVIPYGQHGHSHVAEHSTICVIPYGQHGHLHVAEHSTICVIPYGQHGHLHVAEHSTICVIPATPFALRSTDITW